MPDRGQLVRHRRRVRSGLLVVFALLAACTSSKPAAAPTTVAITAPTTSASSVLPSPTTDATVLPTTAPAPTTPPTTVAGTAIIDVGKLAAPPPPVAAQSGGVLRVALAVFPSNGLSPANFTIVQSGQMIARTIFDSLLNLDSNGGLAPGLALSATPTPDFKIWTLKLRGGVTFHNGEPFNAPSVVANLDACRKGRVAGASFAPLESVTATDAATVVIVMKQPWSSFDQYLTGYFTAGQCGYMVAPAQLAAGEAGGKAPIGTGPFKLLSWADTEVAVTRNASYWRIDADGKQLPYLDGISFTFDNDQENRAQAVITGASDVTFTYRPKVITTMRQAELAGKVKVYATTDFSSTAFWAMNLSRPPFDDVRIRKAFALAIDRDVIKEKLGGIVGLANSPFPPGSVGSLEVNDYPTKPDLVEAKRLIDAYQADKGKLRPLEMMVIDGDPLARLSVDNVVEMLGKVGVPMSVVPVPEQPLIVKAFNGDFDIGSFNSFGTTDPDTNYSFWSSSTTGPNGTPTINYFRLRDPKIDALLTQLRSTRDPFIRERATRDLNKIFADQFYILWNYWVLNGLAWRPNVQGLDQPTLPDTNNDSPPTVNGIPMFTNVFLKS
jgi:peptide/nickel transport system substrate-binding protein